MQVLRIFHGTHDVLWWKMVGWGLAPSINSPLLVKTGDSGCFRFQHVPTCSNLPPALGIIIPKMRLKDMWNYQPVRVSSSVAIQQGLQELGFPPGTGRRVARLRPLQWIQPPNTLGIPDLKQIPSGKRLHNSGQIHHAIHGKTLP